MVAYSRASANARGFFELLLGHRTHAEPAQHESHGFLVIDRAGELESPTSDLVEIRIPLRVQGGFGEDEQRDRLEPRAVQPLCETDRLVAVRTRTVVVAREACEGGQHVHARDDVARGAVRAADRDALVGKGLRPLEVARKPCQQRRRRKPPGPDGRGVGRRLRESLVEPFEALPQIPADEPVVPELRPPAAAPGPAGS